MNRTPTPEIELGPDGKEWAKTEAGAAHVGTMLARADGETHAPYWHGWALREAFVAGAEWQEKRLPTAQASGNPMDGPDSGVALNRAVWLLSEALGLVPQGSEKITVEISVVVLAACEKLRPQALPTRPLVADTLLAEVAGNFTRDDDLPNDLLGRIDAYLTSEGYTE